MEQAAVVYPQKSTIVRVRTPRTANFLFAALQSISTPLAAALLERFFLTPGRSPLSAEEELFLASGQRNDLDSSVGKLAVWTWGEGRTVLLVHGWGSRAARYRTLAPALVQAGFRVVAFDAPGHGGSWRATGGRSSLPEAAQAVREVAGREYEQRGAWPYGVVAHSFGSAATILAQRNGAQFRRNVFFAPSTDFDAYMDRVVDALGIDQPIAARMIERVERRLGFCWDALRVGSSANELKGPALIFHDPADPEVPYADAELLHRVWTGSRLEPTPGVGHRRLLHDRGLVERVIRFVSSA